MIRRPILTSLFALSRASERHRAQKRHRDTLERDQTTDLGERAADQNKRALSSTSVPMNLLVLVYSVIVRKARAIQNTRKLDPKYCPIPQQLFLTSNGFQVTFELRVETYITL